MGDYRFRVEFLEEAKVFLEEMDQKARKKIIYNIWKARTINDIEIFKKLRGDIWEFRTVYNGVCYRLFAFWDKTQKNDTLVVSTHGLVKKTDKAPKHEIERAIRSRERYFNEK